MDCVSVNFVIPHKGREELLIETLRSIRDQQSTVPYHVYVVTQNKNLTEETLGLKAQLPLTFMFAGPGQTNSVLRNTGARRTSSTHLAFLDADVQLSPNWLSKMMETLESDSETILASAMQINGSAPPVLERIRTTLSNANLDAPVRFLPGRNLLMRRETFESAGGFPEHLETCEDYYFTDKVSEIGRLWYSSRASYVHLGEDKRLTDMFRKEIWRGQSNLQSLKGRKLRLAEVPSLSTPLAVCGLFTLSIGLLLSGSVISSYLCAAIAAFPFCAYVTRLYILGNGEIPLLDIVAFYAVYFPARTIGTLRGATRVIATYVSGP
ncbi:MAG: hypothetical protein Cons2KO_30290 [Congregibacter sp.]